MGPWRLELLRVWRTRRLIALAATFLILGLGVPVLTSFLPELVKGATNGVQITVPKQTAADGIAGFAGNVAQLGTLVVVVVAAATLSIDAHPGLAAFYRTRVHRPILLVLPRYAIVTAASVATLALGTFGAWYETTVLLGSVPFGALMGGLALEALWLCFVTSIVTVFTSAIRGVLGVVGGSIALLLTLALLDGLPSAFSWLPTRLAASGGDLIQHPAGDVWHAVVVSSLATVAALSLAVNRLGKRELYPAGTRRTQTGR
jgi:ABC-2 type transport system permease protein